jgi:hypothetical protein
MFIRTDTYSSSFAYMNYSNSYDVKSAVTVFFDYWSTPFPQLPRTVGAIQYFAAVMKLIIGYVLRCSVAPPPPFCCAVSVLHC